MASDGSPRGDKRRLAKLVLTDFGVLQPSQRQEGPVESQEALDPRPHKKPYTRMLRNLFDLTNWGALTSEEGCLPLNKVSGFKKKPTDAQDIRNPNELCPGKELKLLLWGCPHANPSSNDGSHHGPGPRTPEHIVKTQAFESMAWLCPRGMAIMTFPSKDKVEFYQPCSEAAAAKHVFEGVRPDGQ